MISLLLILTSCSSKECETAADCTAKSTEGYKAACIDNFCKYEALPNKCGNDICETTNDENGCTCAQDCKPCTGKVSQSKYLTQQCIEDMCVQDVIQSQVKPVATAKELSSAGDKFSIETVYNQPFNLKKDTFDVAVTLAREGGRNTDIKITALELIGKTEDGRTIILARQPVNKPLWRAGSKITEQIILELQTVLVEGELSNIIINIDYEYSTLRGSTKTPKQETFRNGYNEKIIYVNPDVEYPCPASCDDKNSGTRDYCNAQTNNFCMHEPIPNTCGNFICDANENKCSCEQDCGYCEGSAGDYLDYSCKTNKCTTILKQNIQTEAQNIFDDRRIGSARLNNNYRFNQPFNVLQDSFEFGFAIYEKDEAVGNIVIETIRLLEGQQLLAETQPNAQITQTVNTVTIRSITTNFPEEERRVTLAIWYNYQENGEIKRGQYQKSLGDITFINPQ